MDDSKDLDTSGVDGPNKRFRKQTKRKAVDFNSTLMAEFHSRVLFPDNLNRPELQPCIAFDKELLPAASVKDNPASCVCTKLADTSVNKNNAFSHRCPVFAIAWTPEGRGLIAGNSQVRFTLSCQADVHTIIACCQETDRGINFSLQGEFTLWDGFEFNFLTIWQVCTMPPTLTFASILPSRFNNTALLSPSLHGPAGAQSQKRTMEGKRSSPP